MPSDRPVVIAVALVERDGAYLVQRRDRSPFEGAWEFPGGKLERGESVEDAVRREVREECGFDVDVGELAGVVSHAYDPPLPHVVLVAYFARPVGKPPTGLEWAPRDELGRLDMPPANGRLIALLEAAGSE